jgi:hypothetical protein
MIFSGGQGQLEAPPHLLTTLEEISQRCDTCQRTARKPIRFRATIPRNLAFGEEIELDLMWIRGDAVLHSTDVATGYFSAAWLPRGETSVEIWKALTLCWTTFFHGSLVQLDAIADLDSHPSDGKTYVQG